MESQCSQPSLHHQLVGLRLGGRPLGTEAEHGAGVQDNLKKQVQEFT